MDVILRFLIKNCIQVLITGNLDKLHFFKNSVENMRIHK